MSDIAAIILSAYGTVAWIGGWYMLRTARRLLGESMTILSEAQRLAAKRAQDARAELRAWQERP